MERKKRVQVIYHNNSLTVSWNPQRVSTDVVIEAFNKLGIKIVEYFKGTTLYFLVSASKTAGRRSASIEEICEEGLSPVFVMVRNSIISQSQCIYDLSDGKNFNLNEFTELQPNGDFIDMTEEVKSVVTEPLPPKKKKVRVQTPAEESRNAHTQAEEMRRLRSLG